MNFHLTIRLNFWSLCFTEASYQCYNKNSVRTLCQKIIIMYNLRMYSQKCFFKCQVSFLQRVKKYISFFKTLVFLYKLLKLSSVHSCLKHFSSNLFQRNPTKSQGYHKCWSLIFNSNINHWDWHLHREPEIKFPEYLC